MSVHRILLKFQIVLLKFACLFLSIFDNKEAK